MSLDWLLAPNVGGMDLERATLKVELLANLRRLCYLNGRIQFLAACQLCGAPFLPGLAAPALHELLVERDDAQGCTPEAQFAVLHEEHNLQLLCNEPCNIKLAKDDRLRRFLIYRQIERYGVTPLIAFVKSLDLTDPRPYVLRIEGTAHTWLPRPTESAASPSFIKRRDGLLDQMREHLESYHRPALF